MKHETRFRRLLYKGLPIFVFGPLILSVISGCQSNPQSNKDDWPKNAKDLVKSKITYPIGRSSFLVIDPKNSSYAAYTPTFIPCKTGNLTKVVEISEHVLELNALPKKGEGCLGILLTINTQARNTKLVLYDYTGNPADVKQQYWLINPRFSN